ncbi:MAG: lysophospholipid acyltransferase family protein [Anaeroplasma sp.]
MIIHILLCIISIIASTNIFYFFNLYTTWYYYFSLILILPITYILALTLYLLLLGLISIFLKQKKDIKKPNSFFYFFIYQTAKLVLILVRVKIHTDGLEKLPNNRYLMISNHQSLFDPIISIIYSKNQPLICVSKIENMNIPICGNFIYNAGFIPLNRKSNYEGAKAIAKAISFINSKQSSIYICPEGTRNKNQELLEFHAGSYKIAYKSKCPIVVVSICNTKNILKGFPFKKTHVYFDVLEILNYNDYNLINSTDLAIKTRKMIQDELNERTKLL